MLKKCLSVLRALVAYGAHPMDLNQTNLVPTWSHPGGNAQTLTIEAKSVSGSRVVASVVIEIPLTSEGILRQYFTQADLNALQQKGLDILADIVRKLP